jgi:hypothetical protein
LPFELKRSARERFAMDEFDTTIVTNSAGMRGPELDFARRRVLVMGDSLTFGYGVENDDLYTAVLERLFDGKYQFVNGGFAGGYSPDTYALWLRERSAVVQPDAVIVTIYENDYMDVALNRWVRAGKEITGNDASEPDRIEMPGNIVTSDGAWMRDSRIAHMPAWVRRLIKRSYLVGLIRDRVLHDAPNPPDPAQDNREGPDAARYDAKFSRSLDMLWGAAGPRLIAIYRVYGLSAYAAHARPAPTRMDRLLARFATEHDIPILSNYDDFDPRTDFYSKNQHWNPSGHRKVAAYLHRQLIVLGY